MGGQRCVIYHRISAPNQSMQGSLENLQQYAKDQGWRVAGVFCETISGGAPLTKRRELLRAIALLSHGDVFLIKSLCRLARSLPIAIEAQSKIAAKGSRLVEIEDSTPARLILMSSILSAFSEYERSVIGQRTKAGLAAKRRRGEKTGGALPYGFRLGADGKTLEQEPAEQAILDLIKRLKSEGLSIRAITQELNRRRVKSRSQTWNKTTIARLIKRITTSGGA